MARRKLLMLALFFAMSLILSGCGKLTDTIATEPPWREAMYVTIAPDLLNKIASAFYLLTIPPLLILTLVPVITGGDWGLEYGKGMGLMVAAAITPMVFNLLTQIGQGMFYPEGLELGWVADLMGWLDLLEGDSNPVTVNLAFGFTREIPNYYKIWEMLLGLTIITLVAIAVINVSFKPILMGWVLAGAWAMFPMAYYTLVTEFAEGMPNVVEATLSSYNGSYLIAVILLFITMTVVPPALMIVFAPALGLSTRRSTSTQTVSTNHQTPTGEPDVVDGTVRDGDGTDGAIVAFPFPIDGSDGEDGDNTVSTSTSNGPSGPNGGGKGGPGGPGGIGGNGDGQEDVDPNVVLGSPEDANQQGDSTETDIDSRTVVSEESSLGDTVVGGDDSLLIDNNEDTSVVESEGIEGGDLDLSAVTVEGDSSQIQETDIENLGDNSDITAGDSAVAVGGDSPFISGGDVDVVSLETVDRVGSTPDIPGVENDTVLQDINGTEEVSVSLPDDGRGGFDFPDIQGVDSAARYDRQDRATSVGDAEVVDTNVIETTAREADLDNIVADSHPDAPYVEVSEPPATPRPRVDGRKVARTVGDLAYIGAGMVSDPRAKVVLGAAGALVDVFVPEERSQRQSPPESLQPPDLSKYDDDIVEEEVT